MNTWTHGYVDSLDYTYGFYRELTPSFIKFAALVGGHQTAFDLNEITYCELGCGQGFSTSLLAAANPSGTFFANDFIPSHIVNAQRLAKAAGQRNIRFYDHSFEDFLFEKSLPGSFDIIALHGVYSWVSPQVRDQILTFIREKLRPGGLVYISYNTQPGWTSLMPLRRLFVDCLESGSPRTEAGIEQLIEYARKIESVDAAYFRGANAASSILKKVADMPKQYFAHEFLNHDWTPFYFQDLAKELSDAKLSYISSLDLLDNRDELALTSEQAAMLQQETNPLRREGLRDFFVNKQFRTDIFARGNTPHTFKAGAGEWLKTRFALMKPAGQIAGLIKGRLHNMELNPTILTSVVEALSRRPMTVREILEELTEQTNWSQLTQLLCLLVGANEIHPCLPAEKEQERIESCEAFNRAVSATADDSGHLQFLASPVTGGGIPADRFEQLFVKAILDGHDGAPALCDFAWKILGPQGFRLSRNGELLDSAQENLAELMGHAERFLVKKLPVLRQHRVL